MAHVEPIDDKAVFDIVLLLVHDANAHYAELLDLITPTGARCSYFFKFVCF